MEFLPRQFTAIVSATTKVMAAGYAYFDSFVKA
jgi:hypothetical protein